MIGVEGGAMISELDRVLRILVAVVRLKSLSPVEALSGRLSEIRGVRTVKYE
jgi:hypothetical protein